MHQRFNLWLLGLTLLLPFAPATWADDDKRHNQLRSFYQAEEMITLPDFTPAGAATLIRTKHGLEGRVMVNVDGAGEPYSVWWVIFNNPKKCKYTPCTGGANPLEDLLNPEVGVSVFNASGAISAYNGGTSVGNGVINLDFRTIAGHRPKGLFVLDWEGTPFGDRLRRGNGLKAEVHLVVDRHPNLESWTTELTTTNFGPNTNHRAAIFFPIERKGRRSRH